MELRTLHFTDIEDDVEKAEVVKEYIARKQGTAEAIDAVFMTGDWIQSHPPLGAEKTAGRMARRINSLLTLTPEYLATQKELERLSEQFAAAGKTDETDLTVDEKKKFTAALQAAEKARKKILNDHASVLKDPLLAEVHRGYQKLADVFTGIASMTPVYGIMGNHDLTQGYDILTPTVTFVEKLEKVSIKGRSGREFVVKGDINSCETPGFYGSMDTVLREYFIPYVSGHSFTGISAEVNQLQGAITTTRDNRLEKIKQGKEPDVSEEQLKTMEAQLEHLKDYRKEVLTYAQAERKRLGDKNECDIYLTHKLPLNGAIKNNEGKPKYHPPFTSDTTAEYSVSAKAVLGGHFDEGQIGKRTIDEFLLQETAETATIDGVEVPVYYLDEEEPWQLNPGLRYFFVTEYDAGKDIEQVLLYEFVEE